MKPPFLQAAKTKSTYGNVSTTNYDNMWFNFKYPEEAQKQGIQGRVNIMFTIDQNRGITNIHKRGPDKMLEAEAERIIKLLPEMQPGKQKGQTVGVSFSIPILLNYNK